MSNIEEGASSDPNSGPSQRRWVAFFAALLLGPGAGHMARGRLGRGAICFVLVHLAIGLVPLFRLAGVVGLLAVHLIAVADAVLVKKARRGLPPWKIVLALWAAIVIGGLGVRAAAKAFVVEAYKMPAGSMRPTLEPGDHFFARKLGYQPKRGDLVVFIYPQNESVTFIKRIVAVGGDLVEMRDSVLYLNGKPVPRRKLKEPYRYTAVDENGMAGPKYRSTRYEERLGGRSYDVIYDHGARAMPAGAPFRVPAGHVFVMGDNRDNSHDSRAWGTVPVEKVLGRADFIWWSSGREGVRWRRFGQLLR